MQWISDSVFAMSKRLLNQKMDNLRKGDEVLIHEVGEGKDLMSVLSAWRFRVCHCQGAAGWGGADELEWIVRANSATPCAGEHLSDDAVLGQMT